MEKPNKPQISDEGAAEPAAAAPTLQARSPYRPLSLRRRQEQVVGPESQVERPTTRTKFNASPTTIVAALARSGASPDETARLSWRSAPKAPSRDEDDGDVRS